MEICGEHGDDIAYSGRNCPACSQIDDLKSDYEDRISKLEEDFKDVDSKYADLIDQREKEESSLKEY